MEAATALPHDLLTQAKLNRPEGKTREQIEHTARKFESVFIAQMLGSMFKDVEAEAPFSGGAGEAAFKSFLLDAVAEQMSKAGGLGLADDLTREMLKLQGLD